MRKLPTKTKRWIKRGLIAGVALGLITALAVWMLFQHIPSWYVPVVVSEQDFQRVRDDLLETEDGFTHRLMSAEAFTYTLTDRQINEWVAARHAIWQPAARWIPAQIQDPIIQFRPGKLVLAGLVNHNDAKVIASVHLTASVHGDRVRLKLQRVQGGSLPLPTEWLIETATQFMRDQARNRNRKPENPAVDEDEITRQLAALPDGAYFPNVVTWPNGKRKFSLESVTFDDGACTFRIRPYGPPKSAR